MLLPKKPEPTLVMLLLHMSTVGHTFFLNDQEDWLAHYNSSDLLSLPSRVSQPLFICLEWHRNQSCLHEWPVPANCHLTRWLWQYHSDLSSWETEDSPQYYVQTLDWSFHHTQEWNTHNQPIPLLLMGRMILNLTAFPACQAFILFSIHSVIRLETSAPVGNIIMHHCLRRDHFPLRKTCELKYLVS